MYWNTYLNTFVSKYCSCLPRSVTLIIFTDGRTHTPSLWTSSPSLSTSRHLIGFSRLSWSRSLSPTDPSHFFLFSYGHISFTVYQNILCQPFSSYYRSSNSLFFTQKIILICPLLHFYIFSFLFYVCTLSQNHFSLALNFLTAAVSQLMF